jgi:hypothetical protein
VFRNQRRQTRFSPQNSIFVDFFGAETQAVAGTTLPEQKSMEMKALRPYMTKPFNIARAGLSIHEGIAMKPWVD